MSKLNKWFHATWITVASALGIQYARPPVMDTSTPPAQVHVLTSPTPSASGTPSIVIVTTPSPSPTPVVIGPVPNYPQMVLGKIVGATAAEVVMIQKGTEEANQVLKSNCFRAAALAFNFTERNVDETTTQLTNQQIIDRLSAKSITFGVNVFYGSWTQNYVYKTMGYDIGDGVVYMNRFYADTPEIMGSLEIHEAEGHGQGWHHYGVFATSIPYKWNDFFDLCRGKP